MIRKKQSLDLIAILILIVLSASWGLQQVSIKVANAGVSPILQAGLRSMVATLLLWLWLAARRERLFQTDGTLWWGLAAGLLFAAEFICIYMGLTFTHASRAVIFLYMSPFVVALGAQLFIPGEYLRPLQVIGLGCAFAGIVVAFSESLSLPTYQMLIGDGLLVGAAILWGATTVLIKASPLAEIGPGKVLFYQLAVSALVLPLLSVAVAEPGIVRLTPLIAGALAYQMIWVAFATYLAWFWLIHHYPASRLASFTFLTPLFGVLAGGLLLQEPMTRTLLLALLLVGSGIYLVNRPAPRPQKAAAPRG